MITPEQTKLRRRLAALAKEDRAIVEAMLLQLQEVPRLGRVRGLEVLYAVGRFILDSKAAATRRRRKIETGQLELNLK